MSECTRIISNWLWRFFPVIWLDWIIVRTLDWVTLHLEDEDQRLWLDDDPANCAWLAGWLVLAEERINELVFYKAMRLVKRDCRGREVRRPTPARAVRTLEDLLSLRVAPQLRQRSVRASIGLAKSRPSDRAAAHSFFSVRYHLA